MFDDFNSWRVSNRFQPLSQERFAKQLSLSPEQCRQWIAGMKAVCVAKMEKIKADKQKAKEQLEKDKEELAEELAKVVAEEMTKEVAKEVLDETPVAKEVPDETPEPSEEDEDEDEEEEDEPEEYPELNTMEGMKEMVIRLIKRSDKQLEKIKRLREEVDELRSEKKKKTSEKGQGTNANHAKHGTCEYKYTKGDSQGNICGRVCIASTGEEKEKFCLLHIGFVETANVAGYTKVRRVERKFDLPRCKHIFTFGLKKGMGCERVGKDEFKGLCRWHQKDLEKK